MNESVFQMFYNFVAQLLGNEIAVSDKGVIFCQYISFFFVGFVIFSLFKIVKWFIGVIINR